MITRIHLQGAVKCRHTAVELSLAVIGRLTILQAVGKRSYWPPHQRRISAQHPSTCPSGSLSREIMHFVVGNTNDTLNPLAS